MQIFKAVLIIVSIIAILSFTFIIALKVKASLDTAKLLKNGRNNLHFIYNLLKLNFSPNFIFRNIRLPLNVSKPSESSYTIDILVVTHGGVAVIKVIRMKGYFENPFKGDWRLFFNNNITAFPNPFEVNELGVSAIRNIMRHEQIFNFPIHNLVVLTERNIKLKNREEQLINADRLVPYLKDLDRNHFMSKIEMQNLIKKIRKYRRQKPKPHQ